MDENIFPTAVLPYETKPLFAVVPFDRTDAFPRSARCWAVVAKKNAGQSALSLCWLPELYLCRPQSLQ
jgi:hypothetical protein